MVTVSIVGGMIPICLGIYSMSVVHLFWFPLFCYALGITIFTINTKSLLIIGVCAGVALVLYVIVYFAEPDALALVLRQLQLS